MSNTFFADSASFNHANISGSATVQGDLIITGSIYSTQGVYVNNLITVGLPGSSVDYNSIKAAADSIIDASQNNTYTIRVSPGLYNEDPIQLKSFVAVVGESSESTIVQANNPSSSLFLGADQSFISDMKIQGVTAPSASAILYYTSQSVASQAILYVENVRFGANYTHVKNFPVSGGNAAVQCTNIKYGAQPFTLGFHMTSDGISTGRMLLRNVTTTAGGIQSTTGLVFAKADQPNCTIIANLVGLTKIGSGPAQGIGFWVENGGLLRINTANLQRFDTGIYAPQVGSAPTIDAVGLNFENCTTDVNIIHTGSLGKVAGTDNFSKTIIPYEAPLYEVGKDARRIVVAKKGGDFTSISASVAWITDSDENNRYVIEVGPGQFVEKEIDLTGKPYVSIVGSSIQTTQIFPSSSNQHLIKMGVNNEISFLSLTNAPAGYSALYIDDVGDYAQAHKVSFYDCDTCITVLSSTQDTKFYGEYLDFNGVYSTGSYVSSSNGFIAQASLENYYQFPTGSAGLIGNYGTGATTEIDMYSGAMNGEGASDPTSIAILLENGADLQASGFDLPRWGTTIKIPAASSASFNIVGTMIHDSVNYDFEILHPSSSCRYQGTADHDKINNVSSNFFWAFLDETDGELDITRNLAVTFADGTHTDASTLIFEGSTMGVLTGGTISISGGLDINVTAGKGYCEKAGGNETYVRVDWPAQSLTLPANSSEYIYFTSAGTLSSNTTFPSQVENIVLGRVVTNDTTIEFIDQSPVDSNHTSNKYSRLFREALGPIYAFGSTVTENITPYHLDISAGEYYYSSKEFVPSGGTDITFTRYYSSGSSWNRTTTQTVPSNVYASGSALTAMSASYYTKHTLYLIGDGVDEMYMLVVNDNQYASLVAAEDAGLPTIPTYFSDGVTALAAIYVQSGSANVIQIEDIRPTIGFRAAGVNASSVHGNLLGLNADDHIQYLLVDGTRAMNGDLDLGGNSIVNVDTINATSFTGSLQGTASFATTIFPYTGSVNTILNSSTTLGLQQSESISYTLGSQIISGNYLATNSTGSIAHTRLNSSTLALRIGITSGSVNIPSAAVTIPAQIVGFTLETGSNYSTIFAQRLDTTTLGGGPIDQAGIISVYGGNEQYEIKTNSQDKSLSIRKHDTAGKSIQLVLNNSATGFNLSNNLTSTTASLFKINNSASNIVFETFQDNKVQIGGSLIVTASGLAGIDTSTSLLKDTSQTDSINWTSRTAFSTAAGIVIDWDQQKLYDILGIESADWSGRRLYDSSNNVILDWEAGVFAGSILNAVSASYAATASYALNGGATSAFPYSGSAVITGSLTIYNSGSTAPILKIQGGSGQLFSVTDSFSGSLFNVNNISGQPLLEVTSDNQITFGNPTKRALTTTATNILTASGAFTVYSIPTASYDGAWFEYVAKSGSSARAGQLTAVWSGSQVSFTETTTLGFGNHSGLKFGVFIVGSNFAFTGSATTSGWNIKTIIRSI